MNYYRTANIFAHWGKKYNLIGKGYKFHQNFDSNRLHIKYNIFRSYWCHYSLHIPEVSKDYNLYFQIDNQLVK